MVRRYLSDDLVRMLVEAPFWPQVVADRQLHPEIRNGKVTVYYSGCAIMRELNLRNGQLVCSVSLKHVPFDSDASCDTKLVCTNELGLQFEPTPKAIPLGLGIPKVIAAYKAAARIRPEQQLLGAVLNHSANQGIVIDQEIAFPGNKDRIDLCYFDSIIKKLAFVEIKRVDDTRLRSISGNPPEVLSQLGNYAGRFDAAGPQILAAFRQAISLKRRLQLNARVDRIPEIDPQELLMRPILAIGGCDDGAVASILNGDGCWKPLMDGLPRVAAGLYLFGNRGFTLGLRPGGQTRVWLTRTA